MRGDAPIAAHKVVDDGPMAPSLGARRTAQGRPHRVVGGIIGPRDRAGDVVGVQEILSIVEILPGQLKAFRYHLPSHIPRLRGLPPSLPLNVARAAGTRGCRRMPYSTHLRTALFL